MKKSIHCLSIFFLLLVMNIVAKPIVIGHRGASAYEPENTLRSFKRALDFGLPMIELDVHVAKTGELVVAHDESITISFLRKKYIKDMPWCELRAFDVGKGEHIPLLSQVFDLVDNKMAIDIELKTAAAVKPVAQLIEEYITNKHWDPENFLVTSFDHNAVKEFQRYLPHIKTGLIFDKFAKRIIANAVEYNTPYVVVHYWSATKDLIDQAHKNGIKVFAYTVNNKKTAQKLVRFAIDGIISNYPDILY